MKKGWKSALCPRWMVPFGGREERGCFPFSICQSKTANVSHLEGAFGDTKNLERQRGPRLRRRRDRPWGAAPCRAAAVPRCVTRWRQRAEVRPGLQCGVGICGQTGDGVRGCCAHSACSVRGDSQGFVEFRCKTCLWVWLPSSEELI